MLLLYFIILQINTATNYIRNGDFQSPILPPNTFINANGSDFWIGNYDFKSQGHQLRTLGSGQFVDLQNQMGENGFIKQEIILPFDGNYYFSFDLMAQNQEYQNYRAAIYWNGDLKAEKSPNTMNITRQSVVFFGKQGLNLLELIQIGNDQDMKGVQIDNLQLILLNQTQPSNQSLIESLIEPQFEPSNPNQLPIEPSIQPSTIEVPCQNQEEQLIIIQAYKYLFTLPLNQLISFKYAIMFVDNLWLYNYNKRNYSGLVLNVFQTVTKLEAIKLKAFAYLVSSDALDFQFPQSDYHNFTRPRFILIQSLPYILINVGKPFFMFNAPQNIFICILCCIVFQMIRKYKISIYVRRFHFFSPTFFQIIFEGNLAYFFYICFGHLSMGFNFSIMDKISLMFTIAFLFIALIFSVTFYFLISKFLKKQSCYFIFCFYRIFPTNCFLSIYSVCKGLLQASIHFFLHQHYEYQIIALCLLQAIIITSTIVIQKKYEIFMTKSMFISYITYHSLFIGLNISLFLEILLLNQQYSSIIFLDFQEILIYVMLIISCTMVIIDFIPFEFLKVTNKQRLAKFKKITKNQEQKKENRYEDLQPSEKKYKGPQEQKYKRSQGRKKQRIICKNYDTNL